jgi:PAS domain S-box-containing protein
MSKINILIVEDESIVAMGLERDLEKLGYCVADTVSTGEDAIEKAGEKKPDLILMDIRLDGKLDGIQAAEVIQERYMIPIVYVTAYADDDTLQRAKITAPFGYIIKPFQERELHSVIEMSIYRSKIEKDMRAKNAAIDSSLSAISLGSLDGVINYVNQSFLDLWTYSHPSKIIGKSVETLWNKEMMPFDFLDALKTMTKWDGIAYAKRPDGSSFIGQASFQPVSDRSGTTISWMLTCLDITKQVKLEEETKRTKEYLQNLLDSASEIIVSFDMTFTITTWNAAAEKITGFKRSEVLGKKINKVGVFNDASDLEQNIKHLMNGERNSFNELILLTKKGGKRILSLSYSVIHSTSEKMGILFIGRDITNDFEIHKKLLNGRSYLIPNDQTDFMQLISNLTDSGYNALCIARPHTSFYDLATAFIDIEMCVLSGTKDDGFKHIDDADELCEFALDFCEKHDNPLIVLDDLHYFLIKYSFDYLAKLLLDLNDITDRYNAIFLVLTDKTLFEERQMALLQQELHKIPGNHVNDIYIDDNICRMLKFIYDQNETNSLVSFKKIMSAFDIVYSTAAKRLEILEENKLISIANSGKAKRIYISEKGKTFLHNNEPV